MLYSINATTEDEIRFAPKCDVFTKINKYIKWGKGLGTGKQQKRKIGCQWLEITNNKHMTVKKNKWKNKDTKLSELLTKESNGLMSLWSMLLHLFLYFLILKDVDIYINSVYLISQLSLRQHFLDLNLVLHYEFMFGKASAFQVEGDWLIRI